LILKRSTVKSIPTPTPPSITTQNYNDCSRQLLTVKLANFKRRSMCIYAHLMINTTHLSLTVLLKSRIIVRSTKEVWRLDQIKLRPELFSPILCQSLACRTQVISHQGAVVVKALCSRNQVINRSPATTPSKLSSCQSKSCKSLLCSPKTAVKCSCSTLKLSTSTVKFF